MLEDFAGRVSARQAGHAAAGMGARTAQVHAGDGRPVARVAGHRTHVEELVQRHLAVIEIAFGKTVEALEIRRRQHAPLQHDIPDARRERGERIDHPVREGLPLRVPIARAQLVRRVLRRDRHEVLTLGRQARIAQRGDADVQQRISRTSALAAEQEKQATFLLGILGLLALVVGVAVTFLSQRLLRPIPLLHERVAAVARGDLSSAVDIKRNDELGQLVAEFERMVQALAARDQRLREAALAEQRLQRMQVQIVEALRAAIVVIDRDRVIRTTNPAAEEILGVSSREVGSSIDETSLLRRFPALGAAIEQVAVGGSALTLEGEPIAGFTERLVDVLVTPFGDEAGPEGMRGVLVVADDVSDAVATKSRLIQTERLAAIGRMAAHVTHEVRNPLSSIGLNVDMLGDELSDADAESTKLMESIQQELERLESITEEYLRLARLPEPSLTPDDPTILLRDTADFVQREMDAAGVELSVDLASQLPEVAMDEPQLRQALLNLLRNAREAMPEGGTAKLEATRYEGGVRVQVHDEGAGISEEDREHVFDLFYTTKERGTGLGLPLTQQIVVAHGGNIACKPRHPHGTTFEVWLPPAAQTTTGSPVRRVG